MIGSGAATKTFSIIQTALGEKLYENIGDTTGKRPAGAPTPGSGYTEVSPSGVESYTEVSPSGVEIWGAVSPSGSESYTTITPSGSETWTEI